jgi:hypothetical protein
MSAGPQFDTLKSAQALQAGGFSSQQAEATAHALAEATSSADFATKTDLVQLEQRLLTKIDAVDAKFAVRIDALDAKFTGRIDALDAKLTGRIDALDTKYGGKFDLLEKNMTIRLGGMIVVAVGVLMAAIRYLPAH